MRRMRWSRCAVALLALAAAGCGLRRDRLSYAEAAQLTGGDPAAGREKARDYGCGACHSIPGVPAADGLVGPPLVGIAKRMYVGGVLTNTPDHVVRWIMDPLAADSSTAMPNVGVSEEDARDIAAYLYSLP
jgi:cytochrome c